MRTVGAEVSIDGLDNLKRWLSALDDRSACQQGINVPPKEDTVSDVVRAEKIAKFVDK